ncbi:esterase-like activity of phytase family protein [Streptomyces sp. ISL-100]|uniref:caspase, EACC1-associated type n=1 Tax=Streptomyces sp. ISL-100 TaxID=2819173 RepID=UPI001BE84882|nr:esterase-like activity of phytase family protein [Streptomyces sp. ISL-100]MBT2395951.1 esterase-like activity of phytase family protein [Streptomyces sp. ISL-100]
MTADRLPDPQRSAAVLIGVSDYVHLDPLPATKTGALKLWQLLTDPAVLGLPADRCNVIPNPQHPYELLRAVSTAAADAEDTLLVYYAGHGVVDPEVATLRLSVALTEAQRRYSSVGWNEVRDEIKNSKAQRKIVILDCCHSGLMMESLSAGMDILPMTKITGAYRLAACADDAVALARRGKTYTEFTGALVELLDKGLPESGELLNLDTIFEKLHERVSPKPRKASSGVIGEVPFVRNRARSATVPAETRTGPQTQWWRLRDRRSRIAVSLAAVTAAAAVATGVVIAAPWDKQTPNGTPGPSPTTSHQPPTPSPANAAAPTTGACSPDAALLDFSDLLDDEGYAGNRVVGLSGLTMVGPTEALAVDDKNARLYRITLGTPEKLDVKPTGVIQLKAADGSGYADEEFDGEGLVIQGDSVLVASESAPSIGRFDRRTGLLREDLEVPDRFRPGPGSAAKGSELLESLAMTPDGKHLYSGLQTALSSDRSNQGSDVLRLLHYRSTAKGGWKLDKQLAYPITDGGELAEIVALGNGELLTLDRSYHPLHGNTVQVYRTTLSGQDVTDAADLGTEPTDVLAEKELLFNLADCPQAGAKNSFEPKNKHQPLLTNVEGMALGPELTKGEYRGRRPLYLISDDNDSKTQLTRLYSLAVDVDTYGS